MKRTHTTTLSSTWTACNNINSKRKRDRQVITANNLVKRYGSLLALDGVSFSIGEGEIVGLLGENGAGKSTAMNILTGFLAPTAGSVTVDGIDLFDDPRAAKRRIGYLPEQPPVYPDMTVGEYLSFVYDLKGCTLAKEPHLAEILTATRTTDVRHRLIRNLSKGYRQRVGIAEALVGNPPILIFDEPTVGLDPKQIMEIRNLLRVLGKKHTVILSTHILSEVQAVCDRVIVIDKGRIVADAPTADLTRTAEGCERYIYRIETAERGRAFAAVKAIRGVRHVVVSDLPKEGCYTFTVECEGDVSRDIFRLCAAEQWPIAEARKEDASLEEIFLRLVDGASLTAIKKGKGKKK